MILLSSNHMTNGELIEYLQTFPYSADVSIIMANPRKRKLYALNDLMVVTDMGQPVFLIDVGNESDMDSGMKKVCKECEEIE